MSYLPFVVITIRILDALLGAVFHRFHLLQFLNDAKDRNLILIGTLWQRKNVKITCIEILNVTDVLV